MVMAWMASRSGRWTRVVTGASLVVGGIVRGSPPGRAVALLGLVPLLEGLCDVCLLAPLFGLPVKGVSIRRQTGVLGEDSLMPHPPPAERATLLH